MNADHLIANLSKDLRPVRPVASIPRWTWGLSMVSLGVVGLGLIVVHLRPDVFAQLSQWFYLADIALPLLAMVCLLWILGQDSLPGQTTSKGVMTLAWAVLGCLLFIQLWRVLPLDDEGAKVGLDLAGAKCLMLVLLFALIPTVVITDTIRRRAPRHPWRAGILILLSAISAGAAAITLHCPVDNSIHIALWHFVLPIGIGALVGGIVGSRLRW